MTTDMYQEARTSELSAGAFAGEISSLAETLFSRWQDEKDYEDIEEYRLALQDRAEPMGATIESMTRVPFGFVFNLGGQRFWFKCLKDQMTFTEMKR